MMRASRPRGVLAHSSRAPSRARSTASPKRVRISASSALSVLNQRRTFLPNDSASAAGAPSQNWSTSSGLMLPIVLRGDGGAALEQRARENQGAAARDQEAP